MVMLRHEDPRFALLRECTLIARHWRSFYDSRVRSIDLTAARAGVIYWLSEAGVLTQTELAKIIGVEGPTLVRLLHAFETQKLIERHAVEGDSRLKAVVLMPAGQRAAAIIANENSHLAREALGKLSDKKVERALALLREASSILKESES
jgi:MarR family transcriptional regulator for hemolysin